MKIDPITGERIMSHDEQSEYEHYHTCEHCEMEHETIRRIANMRLCKQCAILIAMCNARSVLAELRDVGFETPTIEAFISMMEVDIDRRT